MPTAVRTSAWALVPFTLFPVSSALLQLNLETRSTCGCGRDRGVVTALTILVKPRHRTQCLSFSIESLNEWA